MSSGDDGGQPRLEHRHDCDAGRRAGLQLRIHADELGPSGGSRVAAALNARSADHLIHVDEDGAARLAAAGVVATLLPIPPVPRIAIDRFMCAHVIRANGDRDLGEGFARSA